MIIDSLSKGLGLVYTTIGILKNLKDLLPSGDRKQDAMQIIEDAERTLMIAEAEIAKGFNYQLCQKHFPPGIMVDIAPFKSKCNVCGQIMDYDK